MPPRSSSRLSRITAIAVCALAVAGCTAPSMLLNAIGAATDTSASWSIVKHVHDKMVEGGPVPCYRLDSLERALAPQCVPYAPGLIRRDDMAGRRLPLCPLAMAAREPRTWPVLAELIDKGAMPEACVRAPLVELAQAQGCPDFAAATPAERRSLRWLAQADARSVHHDTVRMFTCPQAVAAGLHEVVEQWVAQGAMPPGRIGFSPLSALHPDFIGTALSDRLEAQGHQARHGLDPYDGRQRSGFEEAFAGAHFAALDWWFDRVPALANRVPPPQGNQLPWLPLARALQAQGLDQPDQQEAMLRFLLARGADPLRKLPQRPDTTVQRLAREGGSPHAALLEQPPRAVARQPASRPRLASSAGVVGAEP